MEYVVFDKNYVYWLGNTIRSNLGSIFGVALWCFIIVMVVYSIFSVVGKLGN